MLKRIRVDAEAARNTAESGASMTDSQLLTAQAIVIRDLRADLERVTTELAEAKKQAKADIDYLLAVQKDQLARADALIEENRQLKAERDAMREVIEDAVSVLDMEGRPSSLEPRASLERLLARLDATRKAADE